MRQERWTHKCPRCGEIGPYHLMMGECDKCVNEICKENASKPEPFIERNGLLVPNPEAA